MSHFIYIVPLYCPILIIMKVGNNEHHRINDISTYQISYNI